MNIENKVILDTCNKIKTVITIVFVVNVNKLFFEHCTITFYRASPNSYVLISRCSCPPSHFTLIDPALSLK